MSKPDYTHITLLLDASDSMHYHAGALRKAVDTFLEKQKTINTPCTVSAVIFNHNVNSRVCHFQDIDKAQEFISTNYRTSGGTALHDAIGCSAQEVAAKILSLAPNEQPEKVIFAILTDGKENGNSRTHSANSVKDVVDFHEDTYDWEFLYVGSNQHAYEVGKSFGIKAGKALSYASSEEGLEHAMAAVGGAVTRYRLNGAPHANEFFAEADHEFQRSRGARAAPLKSDR